MVLLVVVHPSVSSGAGLVVTVLVNCCWGG